LVKGKELKLPTDRGLSTALAMKGMTIIITSLLIPLVVFKKCDRSIKLIRDGELIMLMLTRKPNQSIVIGDEDPIVITIRSVDGHHVKVGI
jgi:hypothetical protein